MIDPRPVNGLETDAWGIDYYDPQDVDNSDWPLHEDQGELFEKGMYSDDEPS